MAAPLACRAVSGGTASMQRWRWMGGVEDGWWRWRGGHSSDDTNTDRQREGGVEKYSLPFSPASAPRIFPARTRRCSGARRGTSWCPPFYPGAPTRSCGGQADVSGGTVRARDDPHPAVSMATSTGWDVFLLSPPPLSWKSWRLQACLFL